MRKALLIIAAAVLGCTAAMPVELRLGHAYEPTHPWHLGAVEAARVMKEKSGGRITLSVHPSATLGNEQELMEQAITGGLDISASGAGQLANVYETMTLTEMPYLFRDNAHVMKFIKSDKFQDIRKDFHDQHNAYIIGASTYGIRHIIGNKAIRTPADLTGFKLRVPDQRITVGYARAMGANPTPIALGEAYLALQQRAVDGLENPLPTIHAFKFHEVSKFLSLTGHVTNVATFVMNGDSYDKLSPADRKIVEEGIAAGCEHIFKLISESDSKLVQFFKDQGVEVIEPDRKAFAEKTKSMSDEYAKNWSKFGDLYKYIQDLK